MDTFPTPHATGMVERVAKAIYPGIVSGGHWSEVPYEHAMVRPRYSFLREEILATARAAIEAMREPTPYMMAATLPIGPIKVDRPTMILCERTLGLLEPSGFPAEAHAGGMDSAQRLVADWRAMVDAALSEPQP